MPQIPTPESDHWEPPPELLDLIDKKKNKKMRQRDRVELVIAFYAAEHGGNTPTYEKIGQVMGIPRANAHRFAMELTQPWERRAIKTNGKFWLVNSVYSHPIIREPRFRNVVHSE